MSSALVQQDARILDRGEIERRRVIVAELRWIKARMTVAEIATALQQVDPPIVVSLRTVERDIVAIREDSRRYLTANRFDARLEISMSLMRYEMLARKATDHALSKDGSDAARWARVAIRATEAKTTLLQHVGLIDRQIGTLFIDAGEKSDRVPSGTELQERFRDVIVTDADLTSPAELAMRYGDFEAAEAAQREAKD